MTVKRMLAIAGRGERSRRFRALSWPARC